MCLSTMAQSTTRLKHPVSLGMEECRTLFLTAVSNKHQFDQVIVRAHGLASCASHLYLHDARI
jgi:hypothetical protein